MGYSEVWGKLIREKNPDVGNLVALSRLNIPSNTIKKVVKIPRLSIVIPQRYCFYHARYP